MKRMVFVVGFLLSASLIAVPPPPSEGSDDSPERQASHMNYSYDRAGRLVRVDFGDDTGISYQYDSRGNLIRRRAVPAGEIFADGFESGSTIMWPR